MSVLIDKIKYFWSTTKGKIIIIALAIIVMALCVVGFNVVSKMQHAKTINSNIETSSKNAQEGKSNAIKKLTGDKDANKDNNASKEDKDGMGTKGNEKNSNSKDNGVPASKLFDDDLYGNSANLDRADVDDVKDFMETDDYDKVLNDYTTGSISIDSLGIDLPILEGTTNDNLWAGATTFRPNQSISKGNYVLLSHNVGYNGMLFSDLPTIKKGATVKVTSYADGSKKTQKYKVTKTEVLDYQKDADVMNDTDDRRLTLITCLEPTNMTERFVVTAKPV